MNNYLQNKVILIGNILVTASYSFSAKQLDLLFIILAILKKDETKYHIHISTLEKLTNTKWNNTRLKKDTKILGSKVFEIEIPNKSIQLWLFQSVVYENDSGCFTITISQEAKPYLFNLVNKFTTIELKSILSCSSLYAKRIYCLGCHSINKQTGHREISITIDELKEMLKIDKLSKNSKLKQFSHFKKNVLDLAEMQINQFTNLNMSYTLDKNFGRYDKIVFSFSYKSRIRLNEQAALPPIDLISFEDVKCYGFSDNQAKTISQTVSKKEFEKITSDLNYKIQNQRVFIENVTPYLVGIFQNKGILQRK